jgi:hypothetical protein
MKIFVQNQGMRKILPQAYNGYSEDKILSITPSLGEKIVLQMAQGKLINRGAGHCCSRDCCPAVTQARQRSMVTLVSQRQKISE